MSDSGRRDRDRRRVGDATKQRIEDLADGWKVPGSPTRSPKSSKAPFDEPRSSAGHNAVSGELNVDCDAELPDALDRTPPPTRDTGGTPPPRIRRKRPPPPRVPNPILPTRTPVPGVDAPSTLARPVTPGEHGTPPPRPSPPPTPASPPAIPDSGPIIASAKPAREDDATELMTDLPAGLRRDRGDATELQTERATASMVGLPSAPRLPRKRGVAGDIRYVFTVLSGVAKARSELSRVRSHLDEERDHRTDKLLIIAREAVADPKLTVPVVDEARDRLSEVEELRSRDAGAAAAAEAELESLTRTRESERETNAARLADLESRLAAVEEELAPLDKTVSRSQKKVDELTGTLKALDEQIKRLEGRLGSGKGDPATFQAQLASLRAEREAVARDQPASSAEIDELRPRIAQLTGDRDRMREELEALRQEEQAAQGRTDEAVKELRAQKQAKDREVASADQQRNEVLLAMGEKLCLERPPSLALKLRAVDHHDVHIATLERRAMELDDLVRGIDKGALVRGALILLAVASVPVAVLIALL